MEPQRDEARNLLPHLEEAREPPPFQMEEVFATSSRTIRWMRERLPLFRGRRLHDLLR